MTESLPDPSASRFSVSHRPMKVERVEVVTADVDHNYSRVEVSIDGVEFEFSGPDAQVFGAKLNMAGGGQLTAIPTDEHDDDVEHRLLARLERDNLLHPGMDALAARRQLDA